MSIFQKLFGKKAVSKETNTNSQSEHKDFSITVAPMKDKGQYRLHAVISKEIDGETKTHELIRADMFSSLDECSAASLRKAIQVIDEQGEKIF